MRYSKNALIGATPVPGPTSMTGVSGEAGMIRVGAEIPIGRRVPVRSVTCKNGDASTHRLASYRATTSIGRDGVCGDWFCIQPTRLEAGLCQDGPIRQHIYQQRYEDLTSLELAIENCLRRNGGRISHKYSLGSFISRKSPNVSTIVRLGLVA